LREWFAPAVDAVGVDPVPADPVGVAGAAEGSAAAGAVGAVGRGAAVERGTVIGASSAHASYAGSDRAGNAAAALAPGWRAAIASALLVAAVSVPLLLAATLLAADPPMSPGALLELFAVQIALPLAASGAAWRACRADVAVADGRLVVERAHRRIEVPLASIARLEPWRVPLPAPGFAVRLRSGRRLPEAIAAADPGPLLHALAAAGVPGAARAAAGTLAVWASARAPWRRRWRDRLAKFPLFALGPAGVLFYTHQHIAYGGFFGEWRLLGPAAWLRTLALHWGATTVLLLLYAAALRALLEALAIAAARVAPPRAAGVRRAIERAGQAAYFAGVPALLALRYLA
jgi:apolipoprotein N-acyltransferase